MKKGNKLKNIVLILAASLLVGCGTQAKEKETALETKQETVLETTLESKKETLEETSKDTKASEESKGSKKQEIDGTVRPKKSKSVDHKSKEGSTSTKNSSEKKPEPKKEKPVKKKSNEEIAKEVLNGSWGSGQDRKNRLESAGYNYSEVQAIVNKIAPAPVVEKRKPSSSANSGSSYSHSSAVDSMPNNSILVNGVTLWISNHNTQSEIDKAGSRIVNWGSQHVSY